MYIYMHVYMYIITSYNDDVIPKPTMYMTGTLFSMRMAHWPSSKGLKWREEESSSSSRIFSPLSLRHSWMEVHWKRCMHQWPGWQTTGWTCCTARQRACPTQSSLTSSPRIAVCPGSWRTMEHRRAPPSAQPRDLQRYCNFVFWYMYMYMRHSSILWVHV